MVIKIIEIKTREDNAYSKIEHEYNSTTKIYKLQQISFFNTQYIIQTLVR